MAESIVIVGAARTPMGGFQGDFSSLAAHDLGGAAIKAAVERAGIPGDAVGEVLFGNCLMAGQGQAPARQAAFKGGLPKSTGAVTLSKMCGSGMKAAMFAHDMLLAGTHEIMVAGGMESMTNAPYLLLKGRGGYRMGHDKVYDHMMLDGLEDAYQAGRSMGTFGEDCAAKYKFTREAQDAFATASVQRAKKATESGAFAAEITPVTVKDRAGERVISIDEGPGKVKLDKIPHAQARVQEGRHHHRRLQLQHQRRRRRAGDDDREHRQAPGPEAAGAHRRPRTHAQEPEWFTTAPVGATHKLLARRPAGRCRRRPVGSERSLRRGADGADGGAEDLPRHRQRQRRRLRAGPPDRRVRRPHHGHAAPRAEGARRQARHRHAVHRRRRRHGAWPRTGRSAS
jgi:acetyl-CoA C-acetyltransferase